MPRVPLSFSALAKAHCLDLLDAWNFNLQPLPNTARVRVDFVCFYELIYRI